MRDVDRWVGDEGRRVGRQRWRGSDLQPKKTLLLLDLLSGDEPERHQRVSTYSLVLVLTVYPQRTPACVFFSSVLFDANNELCENNENLCNTMYLFSL